MAEKRYSGADDDEIAKRFRLLAPPNGLPGFTRVTRETMRANPDGPRGRRESDDLETLGGLAEECSLAPMARERKAT